eukprot:5966572-Pyramimonas_sp.AAC.1
MKGHHQRLHRQAERERLVPQGRLGHSTRVEQAVPETWQRRHHRQGFVPDTEGILSAGQAHRVCDRAAQAYKVLGGITDQWDDQGLACAILSLVGLPGGDVQAHVGAVDDHFR